MAVTRDALFSAARAEGWRPGAPVIAQIVVALDKLFSDVDLKNARITRAEALAAIKEELESVE